MHCCYLAEELHDPLILTEILVPLEQEHIISPILPLHSDLARPLLRRNHLEGKETHTLVTIAHTKVLMVIAVVSEHSLSLF